MNERDELKRRIQLKLQGLRLKEAEHRRWMQAESEKIKAMKLKLRELDEIRQAAA